MKTVTELLLDLVAIPSLSPGSNQQVIEYIAGQLDSRYWNLKRYPESYSLAPRNTNLVALTRNAAGNSAELALICHTDTVPFDPEWSEAIHPALRTGRVYGRGSCDVKGFLACILSVVSQLDPARLVKPLALVFTADEEIGCIGAKYLRECEAFSTQYMIIGEPTCMQPVRAGKGYALGTIILMGKEAHSAFPSQGHSAIYDAARVVSALEGVARRLEEDSNTDFDPPFTTLNIGLIHGGTAKNIIPGECRITVEWRPIPGQDPELVARLIDQELAILRERIQGFKAEFKVLRNDPAFGPSETQVLSTMLEALTANRAGTISFGSEAAHLSGLAREVVVIGPGNMSVAHQTGEFIAVDDLDSCVTLLGNVITHFCGPNNEC
jgi:acetylornithine deacetylase